MTHRIVNTVRSFALFGAVTLELKTVNSRYLDVQFRMPDELRLAEHTLRERITSLLGPLLNGGREPDLEEVAACLKLPTWTLRRKLAEEGTQFRAILNDTRRDLAMTYIRDTELAFGEIAYLLGFASAEAFQRAFKRWNGQTPGEFRRSHRQSP